MDILTPVGDEVIGDRPDGLSQSIKVQESNAKEFLSAMRTEENFIKHIGSPSFDHIEIEEGGEEHFRAMSDDWIGSSGNDVMTRKTSTEGGAPRKPVM